MNKKKHTIKDVARLAGVSKGTVDRVLHKRGRVSKEALAKVENVLKEIEYLPNPIARNLKKNKIYRICVLIPDSLIDPYWIPAHQGIKDASKEFRPFGVIVDKYLYHPHEKSAFIERSHEAMLSEPDVLLMAPLFQKESLRVLKKCHEENIRVALFNNYIDTVNPEIFVGQDLHQSGKVAGGLIDKMVGINAQIAIIHINMEAHMQLKENGFRAYFDKKNGNQKFLEVQNFKTGDISQFNKDVSSFLDRHPKISAIFITNSKAHLMVKALKQYNYKGFVVGYDLLKENIDFLKKGKIDFLIHQKPKSQAYLGTAYFAEYFLFGKKVPQQKLLPIDIITSENVDYYLE